MNLNLSKSGLARLSEGDLQSATVDSLRGVAKHHFTLRALVGECLRRKYTTANIVQWGVNAGLVGEGPGKVTKAWAETVISQVRKETGNQVKPGSGRKVKAERKDKAEQLIAYCTGPLELDLEDVPKFLYATARVATKLAKQASK